MLRYDPRKIPDDKLVFLLTDSPISDTSDDLISPYHVGLEGNDSSLAVNLSRIGHVLKAITKLPDIAIVEIFFSEGYDCAFHDVHVEADRFEDAAFKIFGPAPEIPSTRFIVS